MIENIGYDHLHAYYLKLGKNPSIKDVDLAIRYKLWFALPRSTRDEIISESISRDQWVGGYSDFNDDHLYTLLKNIDSKNWNK